MSDFEERFKYYLSSKTPAQMTAAVLDEITTAPAVNADHCNKIIIMAIACGCDINAFHNDRTLLMCASESGLVDATHALIAAGADISLRDQDGCTALIRTASDYIYRDDAVSQVIRALIKAGADVTEKGNYDQSALDYAVRDGYIAIVKALVEDNPALRLDKIKLPVSAVMDINHYLQDQKRKMVFRRYLSNGIPLQEPVARPAKPAFKRKPARPC